MADGPDDEELAHLARAVAALKRPATAVPNAALVDLARGSLSGEVTVDFTAEAVLGHPLVVWRPGVEPPSWWAALTPREREVALLITDGLSNEGIARRTDLRVSTVKDHVHAVLRKSGLRRRTQVAALLAPLQSKLEGE